MTPLSPPAARPAGLLCAADPRRVPRLVWQHHCACPFRSHAQKAGGQTLAPCSRLRPRHAPAWPAWRRRRSHRARRAARADLRLPEPPHRPATPIPSYAAIAHKAGVCIRTVASALQRLRELGILNWVRRCAESWRDGRFVLEQETNAYAVLPDTQWRGYRAPQEPPAPAPGTWGNPPPMPSVLAQAALEGDLAGKVQVLASDPKDRLAAALARLGRAFMACDS